MLVESGNRARIALTVPSDAVVYLSDQRMTLAGSNRQYVIPDLEPGRPYAYPIRVELVRGGQLYRAAAEPRIQAGQRLDLVFYETNAGAQSVAQK